jgi:hypothetical protein
MHGRLDSREINDIGDTALSFSEVKALATGNPLLMDKAEADAALSRLQRAERAHHRNQAALEHAIEHYQAQIRTLIWQAGDIDVAIARRHDTRGDPFTMTVNGRDHSKRAAAGKDLKELLEREIAGLDGLRMRTAHPGSLGGFPLAAAIERSLGKTTITIVLDSVPGGTIQLSASDLRTADPAGLITRLENRLDHLEARKQETLASIERARREIAHARDNLGQPFPQAAQLAEARERSRQIDEQLDQMATEHHSGDATEVHEPQYGPDTGHEQAHDALLLATKDAAVSREQPPGHASAAGREAHEAASRTDEAGQRVPPQDRSQPSRERSRDAALAGPQAQGPAAPPTHQPEPSPPQPSRRTGAAGEPRRSEARSWPWPDPRLPPQRSTSGTPEEPGQRAGNYHPSRHGPADRECLPGLSSHHVRPQHGRGFAIRPGQETWVSGQILPFDITEFRTPEHGGPEREA